MKRRTGFVPTKAPSHRDGLLSIFVAALGALLALSLLKFGNPVILDYKLAPPGNIWEFLVWSWPVAWGYVMLAGVALLGGASLLERGRPRPLDETRDVRTPVEVAHADESAHAAFRWPVGVSDWIPWLPLAWLGWQCLSATQTVRWPLTDATLRHFAAAVVCFYLGMLVLSRAQNLAPMWLLALAGFIGVIAVGFDQHFGGLESTRQFVYSQPGWQTQAPEFLKKIASNRIYSTLFYPNTLAGAILLFAPMLLAFALTMEARPALRLAVAAALAIGGIACLYWSGSKAGWLIALVLGLVAWLHSKVGRRIKWLVVAGALVAGLIGFFVKHAAYFEKGATSVGARFDYWRAAVQITASHPLFGSGPGTFSVLYRQLKRPEAEMARLAHNDYLEQASDSGLIGFGIYGLFILGSMALLYRRPFHESDQWGERTRESGPAFLPGSRVRSPHQPRFMGREPVRQKRGSAHDPERAAGILPAGSPACGQSAGNMPASRWFTAAKHDKSEESSLPETDWLRFGVWLGLGGWAMQGLTEFGLHIPALAWPAFLFLGWLWGNQVNPKSHRQVARRRLVFPANEVSVPERPKPEPTRSARSGGFWQSDARPD